MSVSEAFRAVVDASVESMELAPATNGFHLEPRCRICRNDQVRTKVNDLLATGASYAMVLRAIRIRRPRLSAGTGLSAPDMDRIYEIVVIPDVANVDALRAARAIRGIGR